MALSNVHYQDSSSNMEVDENKQTNRQKESSEIPELCKLCGKICLLQSHAIESHLKEVQLLLTRGLHCPECSFKGSDVKSLATHYVASHDAWNVTLESDESDESDVEMSELKSSTNGPKRKVRSGRKKEFEKPRNFAEFSRQVEQNLRTEEGNFAKAVDEKSIKCVCGKVVKTCTKYYWRYLLQRPTVKNGQVIQKGHWFTCPGEKNIFSFITVKTCDVQWRSEYRASLVFE